MKLLDRIARRFGYVRMEVKSNLIAHARQEFKAAHWAPGDDEMQDLICNQVCELLGVFSAHGHSGSSAPYAIKMFTTLAKFEPLVPLTGEDWEWHEVGDGVFQNRRCGRVFKSADSFNGQAYDIDAVVFRDPDGYCFTNADSARAVAFPYTPATEYVDAPQDAE